MAAGSPFPGRLLLDELPSAGQRRSITRRMRPDHRGRAGWDGSTLVSRGTAGRNPTPRDRPGHGTWAWRFDHPFLGAGLRASQQCLRSWRSGPGPARLRAGGSLASALLVGRAGWHALVRARGRRPRRPRGHVHPLARLGTRPRRRGRRRRGQIYVALAAVAWSTAGVLQRQLTLDTSTQVAGRAVFAGTALLAYVAVVERGRVVHAFRSVGLAGVAVALCVATASGSFIAALNHTSVARVLFILAVAPVLAALLARVTLGEPITRRTVLAMALALAGVAVAFAVMIVITRWRHDVSMAPATCLSQAILVAVFLPFAGPGDIGGDDLGWLAALGIGQIGLGFALLTVGARLIPAAQVGLITLLEVVLGPLWVWLALDERPSTPTPVGGGIVIAAIVTQTRAAPAAEPAAEPAP